ncbi:unnamed protein product [Cyprideis torosa]|uniref:Uncharacterized protein n=1 Tax=Cyprideis torosa TaxID=163714 RepID=A0A7R8ZMD1_9CRUS|nr:unnamed protein product [Cyprideis torosa]CAG0885532.1 unnamed protein product [Cyprideis torosa]
MPSGAGESTAISSPAVESDTAENDESALTLLATTCSKVEAESPVPDEGTEDDHIDATGTAGHGETADNRFVVPGGGGQIYMVADGNSTAHGPTQQLQLANGETIQVHAIDPSKLQPAAPQVSTSGILNMGAGIQGAQVIQNGQVFPASSFTASAGFPSFQAVSVDGTGETVYVPQSGTGTTLQPQAPQGTAILMPNGQLLRTMPQPSPQYVTINGQQYQVATPAAQPMVQPIMPIQTHSVGQLVQTSSGQYAIQFVPQVTQMATILTPNGQLQMIPAAQLATQATTGNLIQQSSAHIQLAPSLSMTNQPVTTTASSTLEAGTESSTTNGDGAASDSGSTGGGALVMAEGGDPESEDSDDIEGEGEGDHHGTQPPVQEQQMQTTQQTMHIVTTIAGGITGQPQILTQKPNLIPNVSVIPMMTTGATQIVSSSGHSTPHMVGGLHAPTPQISIIPISSLTTAKFATAGGQTGFQIIQPTSTQQYTIVQPESNEGARWTVVGGTTLGADENGVATSGIATTGTKILRGGIVVAKQKRMACTCPNCRNGFNRTHSMKVSGNVRTHSMKVSGNVRTHSMKGDGSPSKTLEEGEMEDDELGSPPSLTIAPMLSVQDAVEEETKADFAELQFGSGAPSASRVTEDGDPLGLLEDSSPIPEEDPPPSRTELSEASPSSSTKGVSGTREKEDLEAEDSPPPPSPSLQPPPAKVVKIATQKTPVSSKSKIGLNMPEIGP